MIVLEVISISKLDWTHSRQDRNRKSMYIYRLSDLWDSTLSLFLGGWRKKLEACCMGLSADPLVIVTLAVYCPLCYYDTVSQCIARLDVAARYYTWVVTRWPQCNAPHFTLHSALTRTSTDTDTSQSWVVSLVFSKLRNKTDRPILTWNVRTVRISISFHLLSLLVTFNIMLYRLIEISSSCLHCFTSELRAAGPVVGFTFLLTWLGYDQM